MLRPLQGGHTGPPLAPSWHPPEEWTRSLVHVLQVGTLLEPKEIVERMSPEQLSDARMDAYVLSAVLLSSVSSQGFAHPALSLAL